MIGVAIPLAIISSMFFLMTSFMHLTIILSSSKLEPSENICSSEQCNEIALEILKNMDPNVSPCDNFYQFVCGKFIENTKLSHGSDLIKVTDKMKEHISSLIESYLEENSSAEKNKPYHTAFKLYQLCKDENSMKEQEVTHLRQMIEKIGGWPIVEGEKWIEANWENAAGELSKLGFNTGIFFDVKIILTAFNNPTLIELHPIDFHQFSHKSELDLEKVAIKLGADANENIGSSIGDTMVIFDNLTVHRSADESKYEIFMLDEIISNWPSIDWMTFITGYFQILPNITINTYLLVSINGDYIKDLVNLLKRTPKSTIMTYIVAQFVEKSLPYLSREYTMVSDTNSYKKTEESSLARQKYCAQLTTDELQRMAEAIFAVNYVDDQLQNELNNIIGAIKNEMDKLIKQADWMTNRTRKFLTENLSQITYTIGYPDLVESNKYIEEYNDLEFDERSFLYSMWSIKRFKEQIRIKTLINQSPSEKSLSPVTNNLSMYLTEINAHYNSDEKTVVIMPSLLQDPIFNNELPKYINYGGVGYFIGHEIAHGFPSDMKLFLYNKNGSNLDKVQRTKFVTKIRCLINQYNKYIIKDLNKTVNGKKTLLENIADNTGVKLAHLAYKTWVEQEGPEPTLPNLNYTSMQMFWVSYAKNRCTKYDPRSLDKINRNDPHTFVEFRTNGPLSNNAEFSEAFNCPLGSPMNPVNKCIVW